MTDKGMVRRKMLVNADVFRSLLRAIFSERAICGVYYECMGQDEYAHIVIAEKSDKMKMQNPISVDISEMTRQELTVTVIEALDLFFRKAGGGESGA